MSLSPECDHNVDVAHQLRLNEFGLFFGDIDADFGECLRGEFVDGAARAGGPNRPERLPRPPAHPQLRSPLTLSC